MAERKLSDKRISVLNRESGIDIYTESDKSRETIPNNIRETFDDTTGESIEKYKVSNFTKDGVIKLTRNYPQNHVDVDTYDLSVIEVINDSEVNFKFILSVLDGINSTPTLYTSAKFYEKLVENYNSSNPSFTNNAINERSIVVVNVKPIKEKLEKLRQAELDIDIIATDSENRDKVEVIKNVFCLSNYEVDDLGKLKANPTYDRLSLLRYINWVVSKPPQSYDDRLLPADEIGEWNRIEELPADESEPSNRSNRNRASNSYQPIGRKGRYDGEEFEYNGTIYSWVIEDSEWVSNE